MSRTRPVRRPLRLVVLPVLIAGFGDQQGLYPASTFLVPEPATAALAWGFLAIVLVRPWRRMRRRMACRHVRHIP